MDERERQLKTLLTGQRFGADDGHRRQMLTAKEQARGYAEATNGIAVLSDFKNNVNHIYSGLFGRLFGLPEYVENRDSAFESEIFDNIPYDELLERHILELRFFGFLKSVPMDERTDYFAACIVHFQRDGAAQTPVLHTTRYLLCHPNGSVSLGICTYIPLPSIYTNTDGGIVNARTGETVAPEQYGVCDGKLLSRRQTEILSLLAKGEGSKQIADRLSISVHTVNRHRQDILSQLNVSNTTAAVEIGLRMGLI